MLIPLESADVIGNNALMDTFRTMSAAGDWPTAAQACAGAIADLGDPPKDHNFIGFAYVTDGLAADFGSIMTYLRQTTPVQHWVGAVGSGVVGDAREHHHEPALSIMVGALPISSFHLAVGVNGDPRSFPPDVATWVQQTMPGFGIVHANPGYPDAIDAIDTLTIGAGGELGSCFLIGGISVSPQPSGTVAGAEPGGPLSGALFGPGAEVASALTQGCSPLGETHRVTEVKGNMIVSLNDRPALDVLKDDVGELLARDLGRLAGYVHVALPVAGSDLGDYMVRNLMAVYPADGAIGIGGEVDFGDSLMFVRRDPESARMDLIRTVAKLKARLPDTGIKGGLYFSCVARGPSMFGGPETEASIIQRELGPFPMTGFFGGGEICGSRLYAYSGVLVLFC